MYANKRKVQETKHGSWPGRKNGRTDGRKETGGGTANVASATSDSGQTHTYTHRLTHIQMVRGAAKGKFKLKLSTADVLE